MNRGERDEFIVQLKLIELRQQSFDLDGVGILKSMKLKNEYKNLPIGFNLKDLLSYDDNQLTTFSASCGIVKAGARLKADTIINGEPISIKSNNSAPPALVNHTTRPGFEFAAKYSGGNIAHIDDIINEYWELRINKQIGEDVHNSNPLSPFRLKKEELKPILNYFLFDGTGSGLSKLPAERILGFTNPLDISTWKFYDKNDAVNLYWDNLIFSLRAKKGMPEGYPNMMSSRLSLYKPSIDLWTNHIDGDHRGALHIRSK
jgi:hypothetical protein